MIQKIELIENPSIIYHEKKINIDNDISDKNKRFLSLFVHILRFFTRPFLALFLKNKIVA